MNYKVVHMSVAVVFAVASSAEPIDSPFATGKVKSEAEKLAVIEKSVAAWDRVNRWLIEYEAFPVVRDPDSISNPVHKVMSVTASGDLYHLAAHFPGYPWQVDPFSQELFICNGRACHRWPVKRTYSEGSLQIGSYIPGTIWMDALLRVIPKWPLTQYKMPTDPDSDSAVLPLDVLQSSDCHLLENPEEMSGEDCVVFEKRGVERLWIATNKSLCLMRWDIRDSHSKKMIKRILTDKIEQVAPGLWLPVEFRFQFFRRDGSGTSQDVIEEENKIRILRCVLNNDVPDSIFVPVHAPGSLRYEDNQHFTQVSGGGEDLLSNMVSFMTQYAHLPTRPTSRSHLLLYLAGGMFGGFCSGFFFFGLNRDRLAKKPVENRFSVS